MLKLYFRYKKLVKLYFVTHIKFPSSESDAILSKSGGLLGLPSVKKSWLPVRPTKRPATGAAIFSKIGTPRRNGS